MFRNDSDTQKKIDNEAGLAPCFSTIKGLLKMSANKISERVCVKLLLPHFIDKPESKSQVQAQSQIEKAKRNLDYEIPYLGTRILNNQIFLMF